MTKCYAQAYAIVTKSISLLGTLKYNNNRRTAYTQNALNRLS